MQQDIIMVLGLQARLDVIMSSFTQAYFGHVGTNFAMWAELENFCHNYINALRNAASRRKVRAFKVPC